MGGHLDSLIQHQKTDDEVVALIGALGAIDRAAFVSLDDSRTIRTVNEIV